MSEDERAPAVRQDLDDEHRQWLRDRRATGLALVEKYARTEHRAPGPESPPAPAALDAAFEAYWRAPAAEREPMREALEGLAVLLGDHLAHIPGLEWIVVKDDEGADPAIYGEAGELLIYPTTYVESRFERGGALEAATLLVDVNRRWGDLLEAWDGEEI